jgi:hypothetical protein
MNNEGREKQAKGETTGKLREKYIIRGGRGVVVARKSTKKAFPRLYFS